MAIDNKYRVHEVAKDFGRSTKEVTDILTKYAKAPKNHMQVLDDHELSIIFEYFTQNHQVDDLERVLGSQQAAPAGGKKEAAPAKEAAPKADEGETKEEKKEAPRSSRVKQVHRIDTRGGGDVNLAKYDAVSYTHLDAPASRHGKGAKMEKYLHFPCNGMRRVVYYVRKFV